MKVLLLSIFEIFDLMPFFGFIFFLAYVWVPVVDGVDHPQETDINPLQDEKLDRDGEIPATGTIQWVKGADIVSASPLVPGDDGNYFDVTAANAITSIAATQSQPGTIICLHFDAAPTFTHGANLILPGGANITPAAGDEAIMIEFDTNKWRCISYQRADGSSINDVSIATHGLCPTAPNDATQFLRGDATWAVPSRALAQTLTSTYLIVATKATGFPNDDTKPQITEGDQILSQVITPTNASSTILIIFTCNLRRSMTFAIACLFRSGNNDALLTSYGAGVTEAVLNGVFSELAGSTDARTYSIRIGDSTGNNCETNDTATAKFGDTYGCSLTIMEILP